MSKDIFKTSFSRNIFRQKYAQGKDDTWEALSTRLVDDVCGTLQGSAEPQLSKTDQEEILKYHSEMKFIAGGRYLYYAGRPLHAFNNCFLLKAEEDTREEWGALLKRSSDCLMLGGGIGIDYSVFRGKGSPLTRTGGESSGPIPLMISVNEHGRNVMQGGSRRSAIYASLNWQHSDIERFLIIKDWKSLQIGRQKKRDGSPYTVWDVKQDDFNFPAPLDMTNISPNYDDAFLKALESGLPETFVKNVRQALSTAEPGFSFNFGKQGKQTLRNAPVSGDTWILTHDTACQIKDVVGQSVCVWTGKNWAETVFQKTIENASIIQVNLSGDRSIKAEPTHEFLVERYKGAGKQQRKLVSIDRVQAGQLKVGDILHTSLPKVSKDLPFNSVSYTLGFLFGDGSFGHNGADLTLCTDEKKACFEFMDKSYLKSVTTEDCRGYTRAYYKKQFVEGEDKAVCPQYDSWSEATSFLAGIFDADGSFDSKHHRVRLSSVTKSFLQGIQRLLEYCGIRSFLNKGGRSGYGGKVSTTLVVAAEDITKFANSIPTKRLKVSGYISYRSHNVKVISLESRPNEDVYCCDVKLEEHTFCAEGVIISNCTEVCSEDDSDVCNLGSVNMANIETIEEFKAVVQAGARFLVCGTTRADLPYDKVYKVREKNRRLGLGLMGIHEWLLKRGHPYEVVPELLEWLAVYRDESEAAANALCKTLNLSKPVAYRAIAPTGSIGILASTTTAIEPMIAVAFKRRYLTEGTRWKYEYVVDVTADHMIKTLGIDPEKIETAYSLAETPEKRIKFQADVQDFVDMSISSTINLPQWGSDLNNEDKVIPFATTLAKYAPRLRGFTCYPDGSRGGQPLTSVPYYEALKNKDMVFDELDICDLSGKGGTCGG